MRWSLIGRIKNQKLKAQYTISDIEDLEKSRRYQKKHKFQLMSNMQHMKTSTSKA